MNDCKIYLFNHALTPKRMKFGLEVSDESEITQKRSGEGHQIY